MKVAIYSGKKAIRKHNENFLNFQEVQSRLKANQMQMPQEQQMLQESLDTHLMGQGQPATFAVKSAMAKKMGMNYTGDKEQDDNLMIGLKNQSMNKQQTDAVSNENKYKDKEIGLKEKELESKKEEKEEKPVEKAKTPTADEIADAILDKLQTDE